MAGRAAVVALLLACAACGIDEESAAAAYNRARQALLDGEPRVAAAEAERAAALDDGEVRELATFLRGNAVFAQCRSAERAASTAAAEPFAFDVAIAYAEGALRHWSNAAMMRGDWPAARRNCERAQRKLRELRRKKAEAEERQRRRSDPTPKPKPQPPTPPPVNPDRGTKVDEDPTTRVRTAKLSPEEVVRLMERLAEKEQEKQDVRRAERKKRATGAERDW